MVNKTIIRLLLIPLLSICASALYSAPLPAQKNDAQAKLRDDVTAIKMEALLLNRDLSVLEQQTLYPIMSQFSIYLSATDTLPFKDGKITLKINGKTITERRFSAITIAALFKNTIQRLYVGALAPGKHTLQLIYSWKNKKNAAISGEISHTFEKQNQAKLLELTLVKQAYSKAPLFEVLEWE